MVRKITLIVLIVLSLNACQQGRIRTEYKDVFTPINVVPEPPIIKTPILEVNTLTEKDKMDDGELLKAYKITTYQLLDFSKILLTIYDEYMALSKESQNLYDILEKYNAKENSVPMSASNPSGQPLERNDVLVKNESFNFSQDFRLWKTMKHFKELQETINKLESTNYIKEK